MEHYERLGAHYEELWEHSTRFREWMCDRILELAPCPPGASIADIGGGTGIYADALVDRVPNATVFVIDPAEGMLARVPRRAGVIAVHADAAHAVDALANLNTSRVDLVLVKEAVHHFQEPAAELASLASLVGPGGRLLVVMLPTVITYPLFEKALARFTELQPDPSDIAAMLESAGLNVHREQDGYELTISSGKWISMVQNRFMSLLSTYDDDELTTGVAEIRSRLAGVESVTFEDTFEFLVGEKVA